VTDVALGLTQRDLLGIGFLALCLLVGLLAWWVTGIRRK
jgi:hypothetical protein